MMRDILPFLYEYFGDVDFHSHDYAVDCPQCGDTKRHLYVSMEKEVCHCFRCDYSATWVKLVMNVADVTYPWALGKLYVIPKPQQIDGISELLDDSVSIPSKFTSTQFCHPANYVPISPQLRAKGQIPSGMELLFVTRYLKQRGFGKWHWKRYELGLNGSYRVHIPIEGGYWQARAVLTYQSPKYMAPEGDAHDAIFNSSALTLYDEVVICEGAFSAMAVGKNAVAIVGKNPVQEKVRRLAKADVGRYIIAVEQGAEESMYKLAEKLSHAGKEVVIWLYGSDHDPADWVAPIKEEHYGFKSKLNHLLSS